MCIIIDIILDTELRSRSSGVTSSPVTTVPSVFSAVRSR